MQEYDSFVRNRLIPFFKRRMATVRGIENIPPQIPFIFAANHTVSFDHATLASFFAEVVPGKIYFPTKQKYVDFYRRVGFAERLGMIAVDTVRPAACLPALLQKLSEGRIVGIFPEGEGHGGPALKRGKTGVARLALWSGCPVVPVGVSGEAYRGPRVVRWMKICFRREKTVCVRLGRPLVFSRGDRQTEYAELRRITDAIMREVSLLCGRPYSY